MGNEAFALSTWNHGWNEHFYSVASIDTCNSFWQWIKYNIFKIRRMSIYKHKSTNQPNSWSLTVLILKNFINQEIIHWTPYSMFEKLVDLI